jgi:NhaA family Na+:H+ antiporter
MTEPDPTAPSPLVENLPPRPVDRLTRPLARFLAIQSGGGVVLLACTIVALVLANSPAAEWWSKLWHTHVSLEVGEFRLVGDLGHLVVNDVLMTIFFFVVGLEIKRELVTGELRDPRKAALPVVAAVGGMLVPAGIYIAIQHGRPGQHGLGVPTATDIAFVVGIMALLGRRVPAGLKIMLLSLAIVDDIGAVILIAAVYSTNLDWSLLALAGGGLALVYVLNRLGVRTIPIYVLVGGVVWLAMYKAGVHPTVAGVILGLMTPTTEWVPKEAITQSLREIPSPGQQRVESEELKLLSFAAREAVSPLERLETNLHPWVGYVIMPVFALANAGVALGLGAMSDRVAVAVVLGLFVGKPVGIVVFSWFAVRLGLARLPDSVNWPMILGAGSLAGIGFTMSLFIAGLGLEPELLPAGKIGTLMGSLASALVGTTILLVAARRMNVTPPSSDRSCA